MYTHQGCRIISEAQSSLTGYTGPERRGKRGRIVRGFSHKISGQLHLNINALELQQAVTASISGQARQPTLTSPVGVWCLWASTESLSISCESSTNMLEIIP